MTLAVSLGEGLHHLFSFRHSGGKNNDYPREVLFLINCQCFIAELYILGAFKSLIIS